jgi:hypothetical protein
MGIPGFLKRSAFDAMQQMYVNRKEQSMKYDKPQVTSFQRASSVIQNGTGAGAKDSSRMDHRQPGGAPLSTSGAIPGDE